jgi:hypothetical protein
MEFSDRTSHLLKSLTEISDINHRESKQFVISAIQFASRMPVYETCTRHPASRVIIQQAMSLRRALLLEDTAPPKHTHNNHGRDRSHVIPATAPPDKPDAQRTSENLTAEKRQDQNPG